MRRKFILIALFAVIISALAILAGCGSVSSTVSSLLGSSQLSTPTNISYDGTYITWDSVENAQKYSVSVNSGTAISVSSNLYTYSNSDGTQFTVEITAIAEDTEYNSETASHTFIPVQSITDITVSDEGVVSWSPVDNVSGYQVEVDGNVETISYTQYSTLAAGTHSVRVKPYVEGLSSDSITYYSVWSSAKSITICEDVDADTIKYSAITSKLTWSAVSGASSYLVTIQDDSGTVEEIVSATSYEYDAEKGSFTASVQAIGNHATSYNSVNTTSKKFAYLETATNLRVESGILYWDEVEGATGYYIKINGTTQSALLTECKYTGFASSYSYTISIIPTCDDTVYFSSWTADYSFTILSAPTLQWLDMGLDGDAENSIYWDGVSDASGYSLLVTTPAGITETYDYGSDTRSFAYAYAETGVYTVQMKATAASTSSNLKDSVYSAPITVTRLAAPQFVSDNYITSNANSLVQGFTVTFQTVQSASGYQIYKDNVAVTNITNTQYSDADLTSLSTITQQTISYKIQSVGSSYNSASKSVVLSSLSATSLEFSITILATPDLDDEPINGYSYSYSSVSGANGYCVDIDGVANVNDTTTKDLSGLTSGSHTVSVCARGNGSNVLASNYTAALSVVRLTAPTDVYVRTDESEGMLVFTEVDHASSYHAIIDAEEKEFVVNSATDISGYISTSGTTMYFQTIANTYDSGVYYMTSPAGSTVTFVKLAAPTDLTFTGSQLTWNSPSNVSSYSPTYVVYTAQGLTQTVSTGTAVSTSWLTGGTSHTMYIKAVGSTQFYNNTQYINSDSSVSVTAYKLAQPSVKITDNAYSWYAVTNATSYAIYIDGTLSDTEYHVSGEVFTYTPYLSEIKTYSVQIYAIGGAGETLTYIDSEATQIEQTTAQLQTPEFSVSYSESCVSVTGNIVVAITTESPYATGYYYTFGGSTYLSTETSYALNTNTAGSVEVRVYAAGGGFDDDGVYYVNSQSTGYTIYLLGSPTSISMNTDGYISWGAVSNASMYDLTIEFTTTSGDTYTVTVDSNRTTGYDWTNIYEEKGIAFSSVYSVSVSITAKGGSNCVSSAASSAEWPALH